MIYTKQLTKVFGETVAVDQLHLDVEKELFIFLGPNGAGKTTTIKMLTGLLRPTQGSIRIGGIDMLKDPLGAKRLIGYVPEQPHLYEKLTAVEFILFLADIHRVPRREALRRMQRYFELFDLIDTSAALIEELSHGTKQKVALAGALIADPQVLVLDEPTVGLDPKSAHRLKDLLRHLVGRGRTIFMSTHILELAERMCDRIGIIHKGRLLAVNTLDGLRNQAASSAHTLEDIFLQLTGEENTSAFHTGFLEE
ncbi:ABC transporter ATP-binding protein [candidate division KSB1 bacterium]|nr:ABC transporter ATP-binding protein [candidate division KSB1 bacterium]